MLALLYDIHGNLPALDAVLADARAAGADSVLLGGDMVAFGPDPDGTLARLRALPEPALWIRGNTERWLFDVSDAPEPMAIAAAVCRQVIGEEAARELFELPWSADLGDGTTAWHASPVSDMRSFLPAPADDEPELLGELMPGRLVFGHTHLQFKRPAPGGMELVNPGSVGVPLDGDHRAAYGLLDGGEVALRRVAYDHDAAAHALRERFGHAPWVATVSARIERAHP